MSKTREKLVEMRAQAQHRVDEAIEDWGYAPPRILEDVKALDEIIASLGDDEILPPLPAPIRLTHEQVHTAIKRYTCGAYCYVGPLDEGYAIVDGTLDIVKLTAALNQEG